jgi:hypothetical protein
MSGLDERRKGMEEKWAHDEELRFKVHARRDHLLGEWAASKLGLKDKDMHAYVKAVVEAELSRGGEDAVLKKLRADFDAKKVTLSDHMIRRQMEELLKVAGEQVLAKKK